MRNISKFIVSLIEIIFIFIRLTNHSFYYKLNDIIFRTRIIIKCILKFIASLKFSRNMSEYLTLLIIQDVPDLP